mmetsp:Transcript_11409/g.34418  ORF Transcript_11409/g.34418 Transcript_11409/m.34418 type:complete len:589 (-) Transcript_11409:799-2565(-)
MPSASARGVSRGWQPPPPRLRTFAHKSTEQHAVAPPQLPSPMKRHAQGPAPLCALPRAAPWPLSFRTGTFGCRRLSIGSATAARRRRNNRVDGRELRFETRGLQEGSEVEAVVVRGVVLRMVGGRERGHLVPVDGVVKEEVLDLLGDLLIEGHRCVVTPGALRGRDAAAVVPERAEPQEGGERAAVLDLAAAAEVAQLGVGHAHVLLVQLGALGARELRAGLGVRDALQHRDALLAARPLQEGLEVRLVDPADGVDVRGAAVVLGVVAAQGLIDVRGAQDEQGAAGGGLVPVRCPGHELGHEVGHDHAGACLDVLQGNVLHPGAVHLGVRLQLGLGELVSVELQVLEGALQGVRNAVDVDGRVDRANLLGQLLCAPARLVTAVLGRHVARHKDLAAEVLPVAGRVLRPLRDAPDVGEDLLLAPLAAGLQLLHNALAHDRHERGRGGRVRPAGQGQEIAALAAPSQVVPEPGRGPVRDLLHGVVELRGSRLGGRQGQRVRVREPEGDLDAMNRRGGRRLEGARDEVGPEGPHIGEVHGGHDDLHLVEGPELRALRHEAPVHPDHGAAVEPQAAPVAALHVGVQVHAPGL